MSATSLDESLRRIRNLIQADDLEPALDQLGSLVYPAGGDLETSAVAQP